MLRVSSRLALLVLLMAQPLLAQENGTTVTLTVSPSFVHFPAIGGHFPAAVARLSVGRTFTRVIGGDVSVFALMPLGGAAAQAGCPPATKCISTATPSLLSGITTSLFAFLGQSPLRVSGGVGAVGASGGEGFENRSSLATVIGIDWVPQTRNRFAPTFAVRVVQLASPIAGARTLLIPGIGLSF